MDSTARIRDTALRFGPLLAGLALLYVAAYSWQQGAPPAWSLLAERGTTRVHEAAIRTTLVNGSLHHGLQVQVAWPAGSAQVRGLGSLHPSFFSHRRREDAEALLAAFPAGQDIRVRVIDGLPHADRNDRYQLLHAGAMSLMALLLTAIGLVFVIALAPSRPERA